MCCKLCICIILHPATIAVTSALATATKTTIKAKTTATTENNNNNNNDKNNNDGETYGCISFMYSTGHHTCTISQPTPIILHYVSNMEFNHTTLFASTMASTPTHFLLYRYLVQGQCAFIYTCVGGMQTAIIN